MCRSFAFRPCCDPLPLQLEAAQQAQLEHLAPSWQPPHVAFFLKAALLLLWVLVADAAVGRKAPVALLALAVAVPLALLWRNPWLPQQKLSGSTGGTEPSPLETIG